MTYELKLERFSGPLEKLLELIEEQKLEITEISLGQVTDDFLKYVRSLEKVDATLLADFIAVASRLVLIKSKLLLPEFQLTPEEESDISELERRLKLYREIKPGMRIVGQLWRRGEKQFGRPYFLNITFLTAGKGGVGMFYPGTELTTPRLTSALQAIIENLKKFELETRTIKEKIVTIEEKIEEVLRRLQADGATSLKNLAGRKPASEIIAIFLALLHMAHEQQVFLEQEGHLSDIIVRSSRV